MALPEIGYLTLMGTLLCAAHTQENKVSHSEGKHCSQNLRSTELRADNYAYLVFAKKGEDQFLLHNSKNQELWFTFKNHGSDNEKDYAAFKYESLEDTLKNSVLELSSDFETFLRSDDLTSSLTLPAQLTAPKDLPIALIEVRSPCTYRQTAPNTWSGSCQGAGRIATLKSSQKDAPIFETLSLSWAIFEGHQVFSEDFKDTRPPFQRERLFIYGETPDAFEVKLSYKMMPENVWIKKSDLAKIRMANVFELKSIAERIDAVNAQKKSSDSSFDLKNGYQIPPSNSLVHAKSGNMFKRDNSGTLWAQVNFLKESLCESAKENVLFKAWLPVFNPKDSTRIVSASSCD